MNRLVIIGNGFDLAHGLPTSYRHFIDNFWKNIKDNYKSELYKKIIYVDEGHLPFDTVSINNFEDVKNIFNDKYVKGYSNQYVFDKENLELNQKMDFPVPSKTIFKFQNLFFKTINIKNSENWVDVENEYYKEFKSIINKSNNSQDTKKRQVQRLNEEFELVKILLENYLVEEVNKKFDYNRLPVLDWAQQYFSPFERNLERDKDYNKYLDEFPRSDHKELIDFDNKLIEAKKDLSLSEKIDSGKLLRYNYFLNFNYTQTIDLYIYHLERRFIVEQKQIQIHGRLLDKNNQVNFGFGDEMDDDYKKIEDFDDNEFLKYFKSFQYSQNSNYKNLLDYIDSEKFQVYIMGHSCGLSDRTLLNTIFEHKNCRSIKVFYHKKEDGTDNYTEIIQNISRHFNKKALMREKIVNKSLCVPLEQKVRLFSKN